MRIDLVHSKHRPWPLKALLWLAGRIVGMVPGPTLAVTYRPALFNGALRGYVLRAMRSSPAWSKGEAELMAAFVSDRNRCHF